VATEVAEDLLALPRTPDEAFRLKSDVYFTGKPCIHGHVTKRRAVGSVCVTCEYLRNRDQLPVKQKHERIPPDNFIEPAEWKFDGDLTRRKPVLLNGRVVRNVGYLRCLCCRDPFFSEDVKGIRMCITCKTGRYRYPNLDD
jgi:hypothetical protein